MSGNYFANIKKTIYYLQRNGLRDTYLAALERLQEKNKEPWVFVPVSAEEEERQKGYRWAEGFKCKFSILVPTYKTAPEFLHAMIESVLSQTYPDFELILADASGDDSVKKEMERYTEERILYLPLERNAGISENTNAALRVATGDYIGLLDHDDVLTKDALYEMAREIEKLWAEGKEASILYSDEDKCDETGENFYEPHFKTEFNLDLILSNNYFCHFTVMKSELMKKVGFRKAYDGAQDFDLVLQAIAELMQSAKEDGWREKIIHIPKILYHWRCHSGSTAVNPQSKMYAYEAGGRAIASFLEKIGWDGEVQSLKHLGFYRVNYKPDLFSVRADVGVIGGPVYDRKNKITGAIYSKNGENVFEGLKRGFSGYMHRAALRQEAYGVDLRNVAVRDELRELYETTVKDGDTDWKKSSLLFAARVRERGYSIVWDPEKK